VGTQQDDARARLRFHLEMQEGFWFALSVADDRLAREALRAEAEGWAAELGRAFHLHLRTAEALPELAVRLADDARTGVHWVVTDAAEQPAKAFEEAAGLFLMALNERREALRRKLRAGLVVEGPARLKVLLRNLAPDLFSVRACVLEPEGPSPEVEADRPWWLGEGLVDRSQVRQWGQPSLPWQTWAAATDKAPEEARVAMEAVRRMEGRAEPGAHRSRLNAMSRAVEALLAQGWVSEAAPVAEEMLALAEVLVHAEAAPPTPGVPTITADVVWAHSMLAEAVEATAVITRVQGDLQESTDRWRRALALREELAGDTPLDASTASRVADVARCRSHLGEMAVRAGDLKSAEQELAAALEIRQQLADALPQYARWRAALALSWSLMGDLHLDLGDLGGAARAYQVSLDLRQALVDADPGDRPSHAALSVAQGRVGLVRQALGDPTGAREAAEASLQRIEGVAEADPGNVSWQVQLATAWSRLGDAARFQGDLAGARTAWVTALARRRELAAEDPENAHWRLLLAVVLLRLSELAQAEGQVAEAARLSAEALEIAEHLGWEDPSNTAWRLRLAEARLIAAEVARARGDIEEASRLAAAAVEAHAWVDAQGAGGRRTERLGERIRTMVSELGKGLAMGPR
jgi:tetratricopeptide (TPR) repeat protein